MLDKKTNLIIRIIFLLIIVFILALISIHYYINENKDLNSVLQHLVSDNPIVFNYESGFYNETINLELSLDKAFHSASDAKIFYTLNGDTPNDKSTEYNESIILELTDAASVYPIKAIVYYKGEHTEVIENTYVVGKGLEKGTNLPVISITIDSNDLYDEETGLFAYDNILNRSDSMKKVTHMAYFNTDGNLLIDQIVNAKLTGQESAYKPVKSFKIYVNKDYNDKIRYTYGGEISNFSIIEKYKNIKLRSGGQDTTNGNVRNAVISRLSRESNFDCYADIDKAILFLNGEYYGIFDIQQNFSKSFLGNKFNIEDNDNIKKAKGTDMEVLENLKILDLFKTDLNEEKNREKLEERVDIDNYLLYNAIELLTNNSDWPENNITVWWYNGTDKDLNNKYTDGKIRYLLYDMDITYFREDHHPFGEWVVGVDKFKELFDKKYSFSFIMESKYYRDKFITIVSDLINTTFNSDYIMKVIDQEYEKIDAENKLRMDEASYEYAKNSIRDLKEVAYDQYKMLIADIEENYHIKSKYNLYIKNCEGTTIIWNNMIVYPGETYNNKYYKGVNLELKVNSNPGYKFEYWLVNGEKIYDSILSINNLKFDDNIEIETICSRNNDTIIISEISAKSDSDWIRITNVNEEPIKLNHYYLTDDIQNLMKFRLPDITLNNKEFITINGKKNYYAVGDYICNFNLNTTEIVYLYDRENDTIVDKLEIPRMSKHESYGRYLNSTVFKFYNNSRNQRKNLK